MLQQRINSFIIIIFTGCLFISCKQTPVPKPRGYFRIDLPVKNFTKFNGLSAQNVIPVSFMYPEYGNISFSTDDIIEPGWFNIDFPEYKAKIYLTYKPVRHNLESLMEQSYKMNVKNHIIKADAIEETIINDPARKVHGILYDLKGSTATSVQFFVTDSIRHFLRGSLYFDAEPDPDSLMPLTSFFREDILQIIETVAWENNNIPR